MVNFPGHNKVADIIGKTAFLAPLIFTSPLRVLPPLIMILAIFTFPPLHLQINFLLHFH